MSLRDEHLQQALKHAPDSDLVPRELVRKKVLGYANKVNVVSKPSHKPHGHRLAGLLPNIKNWQWAGMGSVAVALLAALMLREQLPPEITRRDTAPKILAQNSAPAPEKALKEERTDTAAAPASIQEEAPARSAGAQEEEKVEMPAPVPALADKDNVVGAAAPEVVAPPAPAEQTPSGQALAKQDKGIVAENTAKIEATPAASMPASDTVAASTEQNEADAKPVAAAKKSVMLVDAGALGVAKANHDIHAGVLRILVADWPLDKSMDKPLVDEATGYRVEIAADLAPEELAAYNQTMRDWFKMQH